MADFVPKKLFLTKGVGMHKDRLASFELALRDAGIEKCNLVYVSSILPPKAEVISREKGVQFLFPGQITFCVMARNESNEPNRLISAAIGIAIPKERNHHGYLSEHHAFGETGQKSGEYAEDLAATMLATTLGVEFNKDVLWTTVLAAAVLLLDECLPEQPKNGSPVQEEQKGLLSNPFKKPSNGVQN